MEKHSSKTDQKSPLKAKNNQILLQPEIVIRFHLRVINKRRNRVGGEKEAILELFDRINRLTFLQVTKRFDLQI